MHLVKQQRCWLVCAVALMCSAGMARAQSNGVDDPQGVFQLEGNATDDSSVCFPLVTGSCTPNVTFSATTDDWLNINNNTSHAKANTGIVGDVVNSQSDTIFTGGSSKDDLDITNWLWKTAKTGQPKDDIEHAFAAAYVLPNGHTAIYFGMDRFDNSGDATGGFWFLQDPTISLSGAKVGGGTHFTGHHIEGDLLVVSDFPNGGAVSEIRIFKWHNGGLVQDTDLTSSATCNPASLSNRGSCAIVNSIDGVQSPWSFTNGSNQHTFAHGELLEGAVDLNAIFGDNIPCFSTFLGETRASTTPNSTLSDITGPHSFPLCSVSVTKACTGSTISGNQITYTFNGNIKNSGSSTIYNATLVDTPPSSSLVANSLVTNVPDTSAGLAGNASVTYTGSFKTTAVLGAGDKNSVSVTASSDPSGTPQNVGPATADWGDPTTGGCPPPVNPGLTLSKKCASCVQPSASGLTVQTTEAVQVCNAGNVAITGIDVKDCRGTIDASGVCSTGFLAPTGWSGLTLAAATASGPTCTTLTATASPNSGNTSCTSGASGNCSFSDVVVASGTAGFSGATVTATPASASCALCPINTTCTTPTFP